MVLKVRRFDPGSGRVKYDHFDVRPKPGQTVLSALLYVRDRFDDSLAFRYSCRGAACGSCAMLINKVPRLACRTQLEALLDGGDKVELQPYPAVTVGEGWKPKTEVLVEPLPHLHVLRDLVVDMSKFFAWYRVVRPKLRARDEPRESARHMDSKTVQALEVYTNCVLCAACVGACPVNGRNPNFLGPAALAKLYRFVRDPREPEDDSRLLAVNHPDGSWGCKFYLNCTRVCPKGVPPSRAIGALRQRLKELGLAPTDAIPTPPEFLPLPAVAVPAEPATPAAAPEFMPEPAGPTRPGAAGAQESVAETMALPEEPAALIIEPVTEPDSAPEPEVVEARETQAPGRSQVEEPTPADPSIPAVLEPAAPRTEPSIPEPEEVRSEERIINPEAAVPAPLLPVEAIPGAAVTAIPEAGEAVLPGMPEPAVTEPVVDDPPEAVAQPESLTAVAESSEPTPASEPKPDEPEKRPEEKDQATYIGTCPAAEPEPPRRSNHEDT